MIDLLFFIAVTIALVLIGTWKSGKIASEESYLFAERKTGLFALSATLIMTEFNPATLISFSQLGYDIGMWALALPLIFLIGLSFYAAVAAKKWKQYDGFSVGKYFEKRYSKAVGRLATAMLMLAMIGFSAVYVKSITVIFSPFLPSLSNWTISLFIIVAVLCMILRGGLGAIVRTDVFSLIILVGFLAVIVFYSKGGIGDHPISYAEGKAILPPSFVSSLIVLTMFTYILAPWYGQKIFAANSIKTAYLSVAIAAVVTFFLYGIAIYATVLFKKPGMMLESSEAAFSQMIHSLLPVGARGAGIAILFAAAATTLSGLWSAMSAMVIGELFEDTKEVNTYQRSMVITFVFALVSLLLANVFVDKIFEKMILANIPVAALSFALLAGFYWEKASTKGALISIVVGCYSGAFAYAYFGDAGGYTWYWAMYGIPATFISGGIGSLLYPDTKAVYA